MWGENETGGDSLSINEQSEMETDEDDEKSARDPTDNKDEQFETVQFVRVRGDGLV